MIAQKAEHFLQELHGLHGLDGCGKGLGVED